MIVSGKDSDAEGRERPRIEFFSSDMDGRPDPLEDLVREANRRGFYVSIRTFPPDQFQASADWLAITAFALAVLGPVYNDAYQWLKVRVPELWRTFFDADNPKRIRAVVLTGDGPATKDWSLAFSMWAEFRHGRVRLAFPETCSESAMRASCAQFANLMRGYALGDSYEGIDLDNEKDCYGGVITVAYSQDVGKLRVVNPYENLEPEDLESLRRLESSIRTRRRGRAAGEG